MTTAALRGRRFVHIRDVLKSAPGDRLDVGLLDGLLGKARVDALNETEVILRPDWIHKPPAPHPLTLVLALPRPIVLKRILHTVTTLGVKNIHLIQTNRVEKSYWQSPVLKRAKITHILKEGLEQAKDTMMPQVYLHKRFKPFVEDLLPVIAGDSVRLVAHPGVGNPAVPIEHPCTLVIGPEGGFVPFEIELLQRQNFSAIHLGSRILKVEAAVTALITKLG